LTILSFEWLFHHSKLNTGNRQSAIKNQKCSWGHSLNENNRRETAKAVTFYTPAPAMVRLCKPAQCREASFTEKTVGGNDDASAVERTLA